MNVDHVATLRQARREGIPDLISAAKLALEGGADSIVAHLREDRRHIQDDDIYNIRRLNTRFDMEMAATSEMLRIALKIRPDIVTVVPEKREELTTEGGLDVAGNFDHIRRLAEKLEDAGIPVSLFIDPAKDQIKAAARSKASFIEIHTGQYALSRSKIHLNDIIGSTLLAKSLGLRVNAGHGLDYNNVSSVARIDGIEELNIGFSIIAKSVFVGMKKAVAEMKRSLAIAVMIAMFSLHAYATVEATSSIEGLGIKAAIGTMETAGTMEAPTELYKTIEMITEDAPQVIVSPTVTERSIFKDVTSDHWAANSVNMLVRLGVTQGYPDGTFRGSNTISRYETAVFLSKLAHSGEYKAAENEKVMEELRAEVYKIRYTLDLYKKPPEKKRPVSGSFFSRLRFGNLVSANAASEKIKAPFGPVFDYRLITSYKQEFGEATSSNNGYIRLGLDTMDANLTGGRDLARELLEAEARVDSSSGLGLSVTSGPGLVIHREGTANIIPCEDYKVYLRPSSGIKFFYEKEGIEGGIGYRATSLEATGLPRTNDSYGYLGYEFKGTWLGSINCSYSLHDFTDNISAKTSSHEAFVSVYSFDVRASKNVQYGLSFGVEASQNTPHNVFSSFSFKAKDFFRTGSSIKLFANKIGTEFFSRPVYPALMGINLFDKLYVPGTYDLGLEVSQNVSKGLTLKMASDIVTGPSGQYGVDEPNSNATFDLSLDMGLFEDAVMSIEYMIFQQPSAAKNASSDMLGLGFKYIY